MKSRNVLFVVVLSLGVTLLGASRDVAKSRFDRSRLQIGTYALPPQFQDEDHIREMAECGIDFLSGVCPEPSVLDLFQKYDIGIIKRKAVPHWWGGWNKNGQMAQLNPLEIYIEAMKEFVDHPAIVGIDAGDEPSALDFEHYGKVVKYLLQQMMPDKFVWVNLFPNYAAAASLTKSEAQSQLGTRDYATYIKKYCECFPLDYISFDSYIWGWSNTPSTLFENLRIVADACAGTGKSLWVVLQSNSFRTRKGELRGPMTENRLRYQANVSLAFGAEVIKWACWGCGWWEDNVLDTNGVKTAQYERLKTVNAELHRIGEDYMKFRRLTTDLVGFDRSADGLKGVGQQSVDASNGAVFRNMKATDGSALAVGHMVARDGGGERAIFIASCDDPHDRNGKFHRITFRADGYLVRAVDGHGVVDIVREDDGSYSLSLVSSAGVLVIATPGS